MPRLSAVLKLKSPPVGETLLCLDERHMDWTAILWALLFNCVFLEYVGFVCYDSLRMLDERIKL